MIMRRGLVALITVAVLGIIIFSALFSQAGVTGNSVYSRFLSFFDKSSSSSGNQNLKVNPPLRLIDVWKSPLTGGNVWDATFGDLDNDGKMEIIYPNWQPTKEVVIFENNGDNSYSEVWSYAITDSGIIKTLDIYDYDNDGNDELIVGNYHNAYYIFKNNGDNSYILLEYVYFYTPVDPEQIVGLEVSDTNNNGINEVIMARSDDASGISRLEIYENGAEIFEYELSNNPSYYFFDLTVGKIDNDNNVDIITGNGGFLYSKLDWWEFNPSTNSYEHRLINLPFSILATTVKIEDIDLDGQNELIVAGKYDKNGVSTLGVLIFNSNSTNQLTYLSSSGFPVVGQNPLDLTLFNLEGNSNLEIFVSTSGTGGYPVMVALFSYDNQQVNFEEFFQDEFGNNELIDFDSIDIAQLDGDNKADMVLTARCCVSNGGEKVYVYEFY